MRIEIDLSRPRWLPRLTTRRRKAIAALAAVGLLAGPTAVWASDFTDVPDNDAAHADINKIVGAGIARGCGSVNDDTYCPNGSVTRRQMAQFLSRAGGAARSTKNAAPGAVIGATDTTLLTLSNFVIPGRAGFQQNIKVDAHVSVKAAETVECPCEATLRLQDDTGDGNKLSADHEVTIPVTGVGGADEFNASVSLSMVVPEPTGLGGTAARDFILVGRISDGTEPLTAIADLTATSYPFDG